MTVNIDKQARISHQRLCEILFYDEEDGAFYWRVSRRRVKAGSLAGRLHGNGYRYIKIDGLHFMEHRLAWFYVKGKWPAELIDHRDRTKNSNNIDNFREASYSQNQFNRSLNINNKSGIKGVSWCATRGKWRATICAHGKRKTIGFYDEPALAGAAYSKLAAELHGSFQS